MAWLEGTFAKVALTINHILFLVRNARDILIIFIVWDLLIILHLLIRVVIDYSAWHSLMDLAFSCLIFLTNLVL